MRELIQKLESLETTLAGIYNIITRNDFTNGEINELIDYERLFWNDYVEATSEGNSNKITELLSKYHGTKIFKCLETTNLTQGVYGAWCSALNDCEFGTQSDLMRLQMLSCLRNLIELSLNEVRFISLRLRDLNTECEAQNEN